MSKATEVKAAFLFLYALIAKLQAELVEALQKPPVGQEELDAAKAELAEYKAKYEALAAQKAADDEAELAEDAEAAELDSELGAALDEFKAAYPDSVVE